MQVRSRDSRSFRDHGCDLQVAALVAVTGLKHRHRAGIPDAGGAPAIKAVHDKHAAIPDGYQLGIGNRDPGVACQVERYLFPARSKRLRSS